MPKGSHGNGDADGVNGERQPRPHKSAGVKEGEVHRPTKGDEANLSCEGGIQPAGDACQSPRAGCESRSGTEGRIFPQSPLQPLLRRRHQTLGILHQVGTGQRLPHSVPYPRPCHRRRNVDVRRKLLHHAWIVDECAQPGRQVEGRGKSGQHLRLLL
eukprot:scaffold18116_cov123-Isochrysis_galbana.AAC.8